ncbi:MAG: hypothetical protein WDZ85_02340 [Candidatus Paceibacterota bacterium]
MNKKLPFRGRIIDENINFPIKPEDIPSHGRTFAIAFDGQLDTARSAWLIVECLKEKGQGWVPFSWAELDCRLDGEGFLNRGNFLFNRLDEPANRIVNNQIVPWGGGWIVCIDGQYRVTEEFIWRCYFGRPIKIDCEKDQTLIKTAIEELSSGQSA